MVRIFGDENTIKREIAFSRRDDAGRPIIEVTPQTRICANCNFSVNDEINLLEINPQCSRFNVLSQTSNNACLVCNARNNIHRLTLECRVHIFINKNILVPATRVSCDHHLNDSGLFSQDILDQLQFVNRPYLLDGQDLQIFMQGLLLEAINSVERRYTDDNCLTDDEFKIMYSVTKAQFRDLYSHCDPIPVIGGRRYVKKKIYCVSFVNYGKV